MNRICCLVALVLRLERFLLCGTELKVNGHTECMRQCENLKYKSAFFGYFCSAPLESFVTFEVVEIESCGMAPFLPPGFFAFLNPFFVCLFSPPCCSPKSTEQWNERRASVDALGMDSLGTQ